MKVVIKCLETNMASGQKHHPVVPIRHFMTCLSNAATQASGHAPCPTFIGEVVTNFVIKMVHVKHPSSG